MALGGLVWGAATGGPEIVHRLLSAPGEGGGVGTAVLRALYGTAEVLAGVLVGLVGLVVVAAFLPVIAAPFNDALSDAVERRVRGRTAPAFSLRKLGRDVARSIGYELGKLALWLSIVVPLFVLSILFPVLGPIVGPLSLFITWVFFGLDYVDWPAARRDATLGDRARMVKKRLGSLVGLGMGVWLLVHLPFVNLLFMPAAVAGGTLLFLDMEAEADARDDRVL